MELTWPLLVWLHEEGDGPAQVKSVFAAMGAEGVVVVAPRGQENAVSGSGNSGWNLSDAGIRFAEERIFNAVAEVKKRANIDERRVFLTGCGAGGSMALAIGCAHPDRFNGIASIDGIVPESTLMRQLHEVRKLQIMLLRTKSANRNMEESDSKFLRLAHAAGLQFEYRLYGAVDDSRRTVFRDLKRWLTDDEVQTEVLQRVTGQ